MDVLGTEGVPVAPLAVRTAADLRARKQFLNSPQALSVYLVEVAGAEGFAARGASEVIHMEDTTHSADHLSQDRVVAVVADLLGRARAHAQIPCGTGTSTRIQIIYTSLQLQDRTATPKPRQWYATEQIRPSRRRFRHRRSSSAPAGSTGARSTRPSRSCRVGERSRLRNT